MTNKILESARTLTRQTRDTIDKIQSPNITKCEVLRAIETAKLLPMHPDVRFLLNVVEDYINDSQ